MLGTANEEDSLNVCLQLHALHHDTSHMRLAGDAATVDIKAAMSALGYRFDYRHSLSTAYLQSTHNLEGDTATTFTAGMSLTATSTPIAPTMPLAMTPSVQTATNTIAISPSVTTTIATMPEEHEKGKGFHKTLLVVGYVSSGTRNGSKAVLAMIVIGGLGYICSVALSM